MSQAKEQMNVQVPADVKELAKTCATAHQKSLNAWIEFAIQQQAARDRKKFRLDAMENALRKVAREYLPGKVATPAQMLAMARRVAREDTTEGLVVREAKPPSARKRRATATTRTTVAR